MDRLANGPVLCAEGYVFELERRGYLQAGAYVPEVVLDFPSAVTELHQEFVRAGSDVVEALTYYAHREKLKAVGRENDLELLNRNALKIAKTVADETGTLMAGNICNTWVYDPENKEATSKIVRDMFEEQVRWAAEEGADFIIAETLAHLGEARIALEVIKKHNLPAVVCFTTSRGLNESADGYEWTEAFQTLEREGADVVGFNCQSGPETLLPLLKKLRKAVNCYTAALPVPYHTTDEQFAMWYLQYEGKQAFPLALESFLCTRAEVADFAEKAQKIGINYIGLCCGAAPYHIRAVAEALGRTTPASRYSPNLSKHGLQKNKQFVAKSEKKFIDHWK